MDWLVGAYAIPVVKYFEYNYSLSLSPSLSLSLSLSLSIYIYIYEEKDHIGILKALKIYAVEQMVKPLLMQCFLNLFDFSILFISHPTELVTP